MGPSHRVFLGGKIVGAGDCNATPAVSVRFLVTVSSASDYWTMLPLTHTAPIRFNDSAKRKKPLFAKSIELASLAI